MQPSLSFCPEAEVNLRWLESVFEGAFIKVVDRTGDSFFIQGQAVKLQVMLDPAKKAISLVVSFAMEEGANFLQAVVSANNCNASLGWARFYVLQTADIKRPRLVVDYTMSYARGMIPFHLVNTCQLLERVALKGVELEFVKQGDA